MTVAAKAPDLSKDPTVRNVVLLAICQALAMSMLSLAMTVTALAGQLVAPDPSLATLPLALQFLAMMLTTLPASLFMGRYGRKPGFLIGVVAGLLGGLISCYGLVENSFPIFIAGAMCLGVFAAISQYYRFAAADTASEAFKSKAISLVLAGGVVAGIVGPEIGKHTKEALDTVFAGAYLAMAVLAVLSSIFLIFLRIPKPTRDLAAKSGRSILEIMAQPRFFVAVFAAAVGYGSMNLIMVSTPPAMTAHAHSFEIAALVIQLHVLGMYVPSFFTGTLISRFRLRPVMALGATLILGCVLVNFSGTTQAHFAIALVLLGVGWNFLFIGGTTMLTDVYWPEEKAKTQAANDFIVFSTVACTALSSGALHSHFGWQTVNLAVVPALLLVLAALAALGRKGPRKLSLETTDSGL